jgi:hypothetical protein
VRGCGRAWFCDVEYCGQGCRGPWQLLRLVQSVGARDQLVSSGALVVYDPVGVQDGAGVEAVFELGQFIPGRAGRVQFSDAVVDG